MGKKKSHSKSRASQLANKPKNKYEKKQQQYVQKKRNAQTVEEMERRIEKFQLSNAVTRYDELILEANKRIAMIRLAGYKSFAADRISRETGSESFDISQVRNREELIREVTRARVFIGDKGSTLEGAKLETAQIQASQYKGLFGNQYNNEENQFKNFDIKRVDEEAFKRAYTAYHKISSHRQSQLANKGGYGSENMIIALYDAEINGKDSLVYGEDLLDTFELTQSTEYKKIHEKTNITFGISGIINDNISGGGNLL